MNMLKSLCIFIGLYVLDSSSFAQSLDDVFKRADKVQAKTEQSVGNSVYSDMEKATTSLKEKVDAGDERAKGANSARVADIDRSKSAPAIKNGGVDSIRSEIYDNVGRKTEGYWVKCRGAGTTRVYRTAWDSNRAWYKPGGITGYYLASADVDISEVAKKLCQ